MSYKYNIGIGNGYGDVYVHFINGKYLLGINCCVQKDEEIKITLDTAKELINKSSNKTLQEFAFEDYNFNYKYEEFNFDTLYMYSEDYDLESDRWDITKEYQAKDKFDFVMNLISD
jgi:hypothetical protein